MSRAITSPGDQSATFVWWAWTQFTWALNAADATHPLVELGTLAATAVAVLDERRANRMAA